MLTLSFSCVFLEGTGASTFESFCWRESNPVCSFTLFRGLCKFPSKLNSIGLVRPAYCACLPNSDLIELLIVQALLYGLAWAPWVNTSFLLFALISESCFLLYIILLHSDPLPFSIQVPYLSASFGVVNVLVKPSVSIYILLEHVTVYRFLLTSLSEFILLSSNGLFAFYPCLIDDRHMLSYQEHPVQLIRFSSGQRFNSKLKDFSC